MEDELAQVFGRRVQVGVMAVSALQTLALYANAETFLDHITNASALWESSGCESGMPASLSWARLQFAKMHCQA